MSRRSERSDRRHLLQQALGRFPEYNSHRRRNPDDSRLLTTKPVFQGNPVSAFQAGGHTNTLGGRAIHLGTLIGITVATGGLNIVFISQVLAPDNNFPIIRLTAEWSAGWR